LHTTNNWKPVKLQYTPSCNPRPTSCRRRHAHLLSGVHGLWRGGSLLAPVSPYARHRGAGTRRYV